MTFFTHLDNENQKIRKQWLKYSLFYFLAYPLLILAYFKNFVWNDLQSGLSTLSLGLISGLIFFGIPYYFAYKKSGTRWLTLCLFIGPFRVANEVLAYLKFSRDSWEISMLILDIIIYAGWYILTWKLRKVNRQMQLRKQFPQEIKTCVEILEGAVSLEELTAKFHELIRSYPQLEAILSHVYRLKKNMFNPIDKLKIVS
jgi:hypothetical protein